MLVPSFSNDDFLSVQKTALVNRGCSSARAKSYYKGGYYFFIEGGVLYAATTLVGGDRETFDTFSQLLEFVTSL